MDELINIYDENNNCLNTEKMKSVAHKTGLWHRVAHIWIYNSKGEIMLQLRSKKKELHPDKWDVTVAGHAMVHEEPLFSAIREIKEEIGLTVKKEDLEFLYVIKNKAVFNDIINNAFYYIYLLKFDGDIERFELQKDEVEEVRFIPIKLLEEELGQQPEKYFPHGDYWMKIIGEVKKRMDKK